MAAPYSVGGNNLMSIPSWTEAEEQLLKRMWEEKASAREIATALGPTYTRSAILGKISRMRRSGAQIARRQELTPMRSQGRPKGSKNKKPPNYSPWHRDVPKQPPTPVAPTPVVESLFEGVSILEAGLSHCRAVIGHDESIHKLAIYCGAPTVDKTSFCQGHFERFYQRRV